MDNRGQGALEYLLLIGGAIVVAAIVITIMLSTAEGSCADVRAQCIEEATTQADPAAAVAECQTTVCTDFPLDWQS